MSRPLPATFVEITLPPRDPALRPARARSLPPLLAYEAERSTRRERWRVFCDLARRWFSELPRCVVIAIPCPAVGEWIIGPVASCPAGLCPRCGGDHDVLRFFSYAELRETFGDEGETTR